VKEGQKDRGTNRLKEGGKEEKKQRDAGTDTHIQRTMKAERHTDKMIDKK